MIDPRTAVLLLAFVGIIFSIVVHECAHGVVAYWCGDPTAYRAGRITLNPLPHIDPFMTIIMPALLMLAGAPVFGGARPVPVNPYNFRNPRRDMMWVAWAGPMSNIVLAALFALAANVVIPVARANPQFAQYLVRVFFLVVFGNLFLAGFNLLPIPPLDGSKILAGLLPARQAEALMSIPTLQGFLILGLFLYLGHRVPLLAHVWDPVWLAGDFLWNVCTFF